MAICCKLVTPRSAVGTGFGLVQMKEEWGRGEVSLSLGNQKWKEAFTVEKDTYWAVVSLWRRHGKMVLIPASVALRPKIRVAKLQRNLSEFLKSSWHQYHSGLCISRACVIVVLPRLGQTSRMVLVCLYLELVAGFCHLTPYPCLRRKLELACRLGEALCLYFRLSLTPCYVCLSAICKLGKW